LRLDIVADVALPGVGNLFLVIELVAGRAEQVLDDVRPGGQIALLLNMIAVMLRVLGQGAQ
jgi:hypothetical protein